MPPRRAARCPARALALLMLLAAVPLAFCARTAQAQKPTPSPPPKPSYPVYQPWRWNSTCKYRAFKVPIETFTAGTYNISWSGASYPLFPLMGNAIYLASEGEQWRGCFGPGENYSNVAILRGVKLPCGYKFSPDNTTIDYWEEQACDVTHRSNCYCYSLDRASPGFCSPGIQKRGRTFSEAELRNCTELIASIKRDGGIPATRTDVYTRPPRGTHYIAAAVEPSAVFSGDFHFWRLDGRRAPNGTVPNPSWSYKAGYTFARNTYRDGAPIPDVEDPAARGAYTLFCGYYDVDKRNYTLGFVTNNVPSPIARAYDAWKAAGIQSTLQAFPRWSAGWFARFNSTYVQTGWEDYPNAVRLPPRPLPSPLPPSPSPPAPARGRSPRKKSPLTRSQPTTAGQAAPVVGRASTLDGSRRSDSSAAAAQRWRAPQRNNPACPPEGCQWDVLPPLE